MTRQITWSKDMVLLLLFMRQELQAEFEFCAEVLRREYPKESFTRQSVGGKYLRLVKKGAKYKRIA